MLKKVRNKLAQLQRSGARGALTIARKLHSDMRCQILSQSTGTFDVLVSDGDEDVEVTVRDIDGEIRFLFAGKGKQLPEHAIAALLEVKDALQKSEPKATQPGVSYTRKGMIKRVLTERREKAAKAKYKIRFADNIYGEHILTNEKGIKYRVTLRDFENETGYINNPDWRTNKLGTTKHIMFAFAKLKANRKLYSSLSKQYPFVELYLDPLHDYRITWHFPHPLPSGVADLIKKYFGKKHYLDDTRAKELLSFIRDAAHFPQILIRPEVEEKVKKAWDAETLIEVKRKAKLDFSVLKVPLFPYQREGVSFATFREGAIIADEMGLGKTIQAIATALMKKAIFGFSRTLIICPASLKEQWKQEIRKFSNEDAEIISGFPAQRVLQYQTSNAHFLILNYETVMRDWLDINRMAPDFIILDEAQKIKNFSALTALSVKMLKKRHALVITGTPIENRLIDLYSIVEFIDPYFLSPLWEFSYQHCFFDRANRNKITGYFNLQQLNERLKSILLRREKRKVLKDLPNITHHTIPVPLHEEQQMYHANCAKGIAAILSKKYISPYDQQKIMLLMASMRMACDSTYLIDHETHVSPKLAELKEVLMGNLDLASSNRKVIIFSEWVTMLDLIAKMLHECGLGFVQLTGKVAVKHRDQLVKKFETDPACKVFLSTEAGGSGLNLQVADTVINFEPPWNPAKKNQRLGRIDRLGQRSQNLTVINFITNDSIETSITTGLLLKQTLFDSVLNEDGILDTLDFSRSGKAQFLQELKVAMDRFVNVDAAQIETKETKPEVADRVEEISLEPEILEPISDQVGDRQLSGVVPENANLQSQQQESMAKVMTMGMDFLSGLIKMATGKDIGLEKQKIEIDKETGEVVMRFKLPEL